MFSGTVRTNAHSAAWRISLWGALAFAFGSMLVFIFLHNFIAHDIQRRTDAWLSGEVETLSDVAQRTPKDSLYGGVVSEIAELASREVPNRQNYRSGLNASVFFLQSGVDGSLALWVGMGDGKAERDAIRRNKTVIDVPFDLHVEGAATPFRVISVPLHDGSRIYLGVSERDELHVLHKLRWRFLLLWLLNVLLGFAIVFFTARRMLRDVQEITDAASRIGESDLSKRVPATGRNDEVGQLASTLNRMLDRIEKSIHQLHTITNSLAHDLRSPLTAIRAKLEMSLTVDAKGTDVDSIVAAIDEIDVLTEVLTRSLDVAEAQAGALRLNRTVIDLQALLRAMIELYEPSMGEKELKIELRSDGPVEVLADAALLHRMFANLFDNELKHLLPSCSVTISLSAAGDSATVMLEDDGAGFASPISASMFQARAKGEDSEGYGLGLAFVEAVVGAHSGDVVAENREEGGARLVIQLPLAA